MTRKSAFQTLALLLYLGWALLARAGDISFSADAQLTAGPDNLDGKLDIKLRATEWIYNPAVFARGEGQRQELGRFETWAPNEVKHLEFSLPSPHRWPGEYDLLVEIHFQDMGGAYLSANLSVRYNLREHSLITQTPGLTIDNLRLQWNADLPSDYNATLFAPAPAYLTASRIAHTPRDIELAWRVDPQRPLRPNWSYPQVARLDFVAQGVHASRLLAWNLLTDDRGSLILDGSAVDPAKTGALPVKISSEATLTASPMKMQGSAQLWFSDYGPLRNVTASTLDARGETVTLATKAQWNPTEPLQMNFEYALDHGLPGSYIMLMTIAFEDAEGYGQSVNLGFEYAVDRAVSAVLPPSVALNGNTLQWQPGGVDPIHLALQVTTSPAWQPLDEPLRPAQNQLHLNRNSTQRTASNWNYPQLARLTWVVDGVHFSSVLSWTMQTDAQGNWAAGETGRPNEPATSNKPWWRRANLLWFGVVLLLGIGLIFGVLRPSKGTKSG